MQGTDTYGQLPDRLEASSKTLRDFVKPNQTLMLDIVLRRVVREGVFGLDLDRRPRKFAGDPPGAPIAGSDGWGRLAESTERTS